MGAVPAVSVLAVLLGVSVVFVAAWWCCPCCLVGVVLLCVFVAALCVFAAVVSVPAVVCLLLGVLAGVPCCWKVGKRKDNTNIKHQYQPKLYPHH